MNFLCYYSLVMFFLFPVKGARTKVRNERLR